MKLAAVATILGLLWAPCLAFGSSSPLFLKSRSSPIKKSNIPLPRGGEDSASSLSASPTEYAEAAKTLFTNIIGPASMLAGGLVPLGFMSTEPLMDKGQKWIHRARGLYGFLAVTSLLNELMAIMYGTVAVNKLMQIGSTKGATSVFALIQGEYQLSWVGANVHFGMGLFGYGGLILLRALCNYQSPLNLYLAGIASSALMGMASIHNVNVAKGDGRGQSLGSNVLALGTRYIRLLAQMIREKKTPVALLSLLLFFYCSIRTIHYLLTAEQPVA